MWCFLRWCRSNVKLQFLTCIIFSKTFTWSELTSYSYMTGHIKNVSQPVFLFFFFFTILYTVNITFRSLWGPIASNWSVLLVHCFIHLCFMLIWSGLPSQDCESNLWEWVKRIIRYCFFRRKICPILLSFNIVIFINIISSSSATFFLKKPDWNDLWIIVYD